MTIGLAPPSLTALTSALTAFASDRGDEEPILPRRSGLERTVEILMPAKLESVPAPRPSRPWEAAVEAVGDPLGELRIDVDEVAEHPRADMFEVDLGKLEDERGREMRLLGRSQRAEEHPRLAVMVGEAFRADAQLAALLVFLRPALEGGETGHRAFARAGRLARLPQAVRLVIGAALVEASAMWPSLWKVHQPGIWRVDRELVNCRAEPLQLGVRRKEPPLSSGSL